MLLRILPAAGVAAALATYLRYRQDIRAIRTAAERGGRIAKTAAGPIEYAESGSGAPALIIHGAGGGYDQGRLIGRDLGPGYRLIAPSRFGYLRTPVPSDPSPAAQADAYCALLDHLGIDRTVVLGLSAGGPSAIELAVRHPERVSALILLVPRTYDPTNSIGVDETAQSQAVLKIVERSADFLFWLGIRVARSSLVRFLGVLPDLEASQPARERERVNEVMRSILPLSSRVKGIAVDSQTKLSPWPLEQIDVPTLIISAEDDLFKTLPGARFTANHIAGAELHVLEHGGHLMVGQGPRVRRWISDFLARSEQGLSRAREAESRVGVPQVRVEAESLA